MRKLATALTALSLSLMGSAAALADAGPQGYGSQGYGPQNHGQPGYQQNYGPNGPVAPRPNYGGGNNGGFQDQWKRDGRFDRDFGGEGFDDHSYDNDKRFNLRFDFGRQHGNFDRWERGWGYSGYDDFRGHRTLNKWQIVRMLERQGFYGVRGLQKARQGFGLRAFAFNTRGRPVMLRVNPFTGRVMDARYIGQYGYRN